MANESKLNWQHRATAEGIAHAWTRGDKDTIDAIYEALVDAEARGSASVAAGAWVKLYKPDGYLAVAEGESYLFAIEVSSNKYPAHWEFFSDAIVWDAETEPQWADGQHGWDLNDEIWFRPCPEPPTPTKKPTP